MTDTCGDHPVYADMIPLWRTHAMRGLFATPMVA
ncbi:hypothetical protein KOEU_21580 [Komagataeibacter europaeus]|uniref:Uncharacterized protein n=1 Tax=Komagataeibacter europaeus TaxID=33995 RepID=A0A0M0EG83_KOMEU|nr:hypothetical protein KOEU_21580 [Komagataeibacter europaeus]